MWLCITGVVCTDPEFGGGAVGPDPPPPEKKSQNTGSLSNTGPDPLKNHNATKPVFKWRFTDEPMMARFSAIWILFPFIN